MFGILSMVLFSFCLGLITQLLQGEGERNDRFPMLLALNIVLLTCFIGVAVSCNKYFLIFSETLAYESHIQIIAATVIAIVAAQFIFFSGMLVCFALNTWLGGQFNETIS